MTSMCRQWKMNLIFRQMEDGLNFIGTWKMTSNIFFLLLHIKGNIICFGNW
jgi:hypothetical protein